MRRSYANKGLSRFWYPMEPRADTQGGLHSTLCLCYSLKPILIRYLRQGLVKRLMIWKYFNRL